MAQNNYKIWFISDTHFNHRNILKFQKNRCDVIGITEDMTDAEKQYKHTEYIINMWNMTVKKEDHIYILGDFSFASTDDTRKILERLHGNKHLIIGNHDKSCKGLENYFVSVSQIKEFPVKKHLYDFLDENIYLVLCHFPMAAWNRRLHGAIHLHGHTHGVFDKINKNSGELRLEIGLDGELANFGLVSLESVYKFMKEKLVEGGFKTFEEYIEHKSLIDGIRY